MSIPILRFDHKGLRSIVIVRYAQAHDIDQLVIFSCGHASEKLKAYAPQYMHIIDIAPSGMFQTNKWFTPAEIGRIFPAALDVTSGHLSEGLMASVAARFKDHLGELRYNDYYFPVGSGEGITCLRMAYPDVNFRGFRVNGDAAHAYHEGAPLNAIVGSVITVPKRSYLPDVRLN